MPAVPDGETGGAVESLLARYDERVARIARAARALLLERLPGIAEQPDGSAAIVGYGYGPGYAGMVCTLILSRKGVKLGFYKGATLPDPDRILAGSGKVHRYAALDSPEALADPRLGRMIDAALAAHRRRRAPTLSAS